MSNAPVILTYMSTQASRREAAAEKIAAEYAARYPWLATSATLPTVAESAPAAPVASPQPTDRTWVTTKHIAVGDEINTGPRDMVPAEWFTVEAIELADRSWKRITLVAADGTRRVAEMGAASKVWKRTA